MFGNATTLFTRAKMGRSMLQRGAPPVGLVTFGLLANADISMHWRNIDIHDTQLFVFPHDGELHGITQADFDVFTMSFSETRLNQICVALELPDFRELLGGHEAFDCHPEQLLRLRRWLHQFDFDLVSSGSGVNTSARLCQLEEELARHLITTLAGSTARQCKPAMRKRDRVLKLAVSYLEESESPVSSVQDLCSMADVSERTLEYAFRERYNQTPKAFIIRHHLNTVRKMLRYADSDATKINEIAGRHGFWHMGQFAADYKRLFRELPSETLRKA